MLHLVAPLSPPLPRFHEEPYPFRGTALSVAFAAHDDLSQAEAGCRLRLALAPPVAPEDGYLVLPLRARTELLGALSRGAVGRLGSWFAEARVVRAELDVAPTPRLWIGASWRATSRFEAPPDQVLTAGTAARTLGELRGVQPLERLFPAGLFDAEGLAVAWAADEVCGPALRGPSGGAPGCGGYVWTARLGEELAVRLALYADEDDDGSLYANVMPVGLRLGG
jgi:hypothetical protein